jgi:hypothetical protein
MGGLTVVVVGGAVVVVERGAVVVEVVVVARGRRHQRQVRVVSAAALIVAESPDFAVGAEPVAGAEPVLGTLAHADATSATPATTSVSRVPTPRRLRPSDERARLHPTMLRIRHCP